MTGFRDAEGLTKVLTGYNDDDRKKYSIGRGGW